MPRLRATTGLSTLALLVGIAGTAWLSDLTRQWPNPSDHAARVPRVHVTPRNLSSAHPGDGPVGVRQPRRAWRKHIVGGVTVEAAPPAPPASLQPMATPDDTSQSWDQLRGHLDGRVIVQLQVDAAGRVDRASVAVSSGDPVLDQDALHSVRGWRFTVPPGHPDGLGGELAMRFSSQDRAAGMH